VIVYQNRAIFSLSYHFLELVTKYCYSQLQLTRLNLFFGIEVPILVFEVPILVFEVPILVFEVPIGIQSTNSSSCWWIVT
jgi:hypothetical protein